MVLMDEEGDSLYELGEFLGRCTSNFAEYTALVRGLTAAKKLGAKRAELLDYRTSGDVSGDFTRVVGYGAVVIE